MIFQHLKSRAAKRIIECKKRQGRLSCKHLFDRWHEYVAVESLAEPGAVAEVGTHCRKCAGNQQGSVTARLAVARRVQRVCNSLALQSTGQANTAAPLRKQRSLSSPMYLACRRTELKRAHTLWTCARQQVDYCQTRGALLASAWQMAFLRDGVSHQIAGAEGEPRSSDRGIWEATADVLEHSAQIGRETGREEKGGD